MDSINDVVLTGIVKSVEPLKQKQDRAVIDFRLAQTRDTGSEAYNEFSCVAFGNRAVRIARLIKATDKVLVRGYLSSRRITIDGSKKSKTVVEVVVCKVLKLEA